MVTLSQEVKPSTQHIDLELTKTNGSVTLRLDADGENGCANPDQKVVIVTFLDPIANPPVKNLDPGVACLGQQNIILLCKRNC